MQKNTTPTQTYRFHITGMHCQACILLTESELCEHPKVISAKSNLRKRFVEVQGDFRSTPEEVLVEELNALLLKHGYHLSIKPFAEKRRWSDFRVAVPLALLFIGFFILLQKMGLANFVNVKEMSYGVAFLIGVVASLSSCLAVVGGLALSVSASFAKNGDTVKPQLFFHVGRLVSFFFLGGLIGVLGSHLTVGAMGILILSILTSLVMLLLGLNLLDIFSWTKIVQLGIPKSITEQAYRLKNWNSRFTPFFLGAVTFFLPCGFTQSMQLYTLLTGSFFTGALTMTVFALGTLPVLALLSFGSLGIRSESHMSIFFKTSGLVVIVFALFAFSGSLVAVGVLPPLFNL